MGGERAIVARAVAAVPECPGLTVGPFEPQYRRSRGSARPDSRLTVRYGGLTQTYTVPAKASFRPETIHHLTGR